MSSLHPAVTAVTAAHLADVPSASGVAASAAVQSPPATPPRRPWSSLWTVRASISRRAYWVLALTGLIAPLLGCWAGGRWPPGAGWTRPSCPRLVRCWASSGSG